MDGIVSLVPTEAIRDDEWAGRPGQRTEAKGPSP